MNLTVFNHLPEDDARGKLLNCCGSARWSDEMAKLRPFESVAAMCEQAEKIWNRLTPDDWLEAFTHHPRIGDLASLRSKWTKEEQLGANHASEETLEGLARGNKEYEKKFGHIFLVCATGKTADEMLELLRERLPNDPKAELRIAAGEQNKITKLRLEKLFKP